MLVLSRKKNESIRIGDTIEVRLVSTGRNRARIAISAPAGVPIHRLEVWESAQEFGGGDSSQILDACDSSLGAGI